MGYHTNTFNEYRYENGNRISKQYVIIKSIAKDESKKSNELWSKIQSVLSMQNVKSHLKTEMIEKMKLNVWNVNEFVSEIK